MDLKQESLKLNVLNVTMNGDKWSITLESSEVLKNSLPSSRIDCS